MICLFSFFSFIYLLLASGSHLWRGLEGYYSWSLHFSFFVGIALWGERGLFFFFSFFILFFSRSTRMAGNKYALLRGFEVDEGDLLQTNPESSDGP